MDELSITTFVLFQTEITISKIEALEKCELLFSILNYFKNSV